MNFGKSRQIHAFPLILTLNIVNWINSLWEFSFSTVIKIKNDIQGLKSYSNVASIPPINRDGVLYECSPLPEATSKWFKLSNSVAKTVKCWELRVNCSHPYMTAALESGTNYWQVITKLIARAATCTRHKTYNRYGWTSQDRTWELWGGLEYRLEYETLCVPYSIPANKYCTTLSGT